MWKRPRLLMLCVLASGLQAACQDKEAEQQFAALSPRLEALRAKVRDLNQALPPVGQEHEQACTPALPDSVVLYTLDGRIMEDIAGVRPLDGKIRRQARDASGSALTVPSVADVEAMRKDTFGAHVGFLAKRLPVSERVTHVVVLRTETYDAGQLTGNTIDRPAHWKGWAFVMSVSPAKVIGAWPFDVRSADRMEGLVFNNRTKDLLYSNLDYLMNTATDEASQRLCGRKVHRGNESPF